MKYPWKSYGSSFTVKDSPLPKDKRKRPWPTIRKYGFKVKTRMQYFAAMLESEKKRMFEELGGISIFQRGRMDES